MIALFIMLFMFVCVYSFQYLGHFSLKLQFFLQRRIILFLPNSAVKPQGAGNELHFADQRPIQIRKLSYHLVVRDL